VELILSPSNIRPAVMEPGVDVRTRSPWEPLERFLEVRAWQREKVDFLPVPLLVTPGDGFCPREDLYRLLCRLNPRLPVPYRLLTVPLATGQSVWQCLLFEEEFGWGQPWDTLGGPLSLQILLEAMEQDGWRPVLFLQNLPLSELGAQSLLLQVARRRLWWGQLPRSTVVVGEVCSPLPELSLPPVLAGSVFYL